MASFLARISTSPYPDHIFEYDELCGGQCVAPEPAQLDLTISKVMSDPRRSGCSSERSAIGRYDFPQFPSDLYGALGYYTKLYVSK